MVKSSKRIIHTCDDEMKIVKIFAAWHYEVESPQATINTSKPLV